MRLWDALYEVMKLGKVVLYFPGDAPPLIADESVARHLPADMVKALGQPRRVRSGAEIVDVIRHS